MAVLTVPVCTQWTVLLSLLRLRPRGCRTSAVTSLGLSREGYLSEVMCMALMCLLVKARCAMLVSC